MSSADKKLNNPAQAGSVAINLDAPPTALARQAARILADTIAERTGVIPVRNGSAALAVTLAVKSALPAEGFAIQRAGVGAWTIAGGSERGLIYGVGKFLREAEYWRGVFKPGSWTGKSVPEKPVRGIYFATHFGNYYHNAPLSEIERYMNELALWGYNAVLVTFDTHIYRNLRDSAAQSTIRRLRAILRGANRAGMSGALSLIANAGYMSTPTRLRAIRQAGQNGYHHSPWGFGEEVCPSRPGGMELIGRTHEELLQALADLDLGYLCLWPYDEGGCTCAGCAPWGANGFLRVSKQWARMSREYFPKAKIILSTWHYEWFGSGEWEGLDQAFRREKPWVDYIMADESSKPFAKFPLRPGVLGGVPVLSFPEISMHGMNPWGKLGANPQPEHYQRIWNSYGKRNKVQGGFPYSEGIYEDINKVLFAQWFWKAKRPGWDVVREYVRYYFGPGAVQPALRAVRFMERSMDIAWGMCACGRHYPPVWPGKKDHGARPVFEELQKLDKTLPAYVRASWRWRVFYLRAKLEAEWVRTQGAPSPAMDAAFAELSDIYHVNKNSTIYVRPQGKHTRDMQIKKMRAI